MTKKQDNGEIEILLEDLDEDDITSLLKKWNEIVTISKKLSELEDMLRTRIKTYLKERNWDRYMDKETKIGVTISSHKRVTIDKTQLKKLLTPEQITKISKTSTVEKLLIVNKETRERMKKYVKPNKKIS